MSDKPVFTKYIKELSAVALQGDAREESFYPTLAGMLATIAKETGRAHVHVNTLPKPTDAGHPDFRLWNGTDRIIGYVEAKKPTEERLDVIEESEQLTRYRSTFPNLILTNFLEFRLYRNGERVETVLAARPMVDRQSPLNFDGKVRWVMRNRGGRNHEPKRRQHRSPPVGRGG